MDFIFGYLIGLDGDGNYKGSLFINVLAIALVYFGIQIFAVEVMSKFTYILIFSYLALTVLIYRYSYDLGDDIRGAIYLVLLLINLIVCVMISFIFFDKLGHEPLYKVMNYISNVDNWFLNLLEFPVMILDVYIRVCLFRDIQKVVLWLLYIVFRLPIVTKLKSKSQIKK